MQSHLNYGSLHTPVLMIILNRPETTTLVFEAIRKAKPPRLYIATEVLRTKVRTNVERFAAFQEIIQNVDWDCEVKTHFLDDANPGIATSLAATWFFKHEEEGIILEDDCLPSQSFFWYCEELLQRFRHHHQIMHIGGTNFLNSLRKDNDYSYYFSRSGHISGWATWRRAWKKFDFDTELYTKMMADQYFNNFFLNWPEKFYRHSKFKKTASAKDQLNWWDYQWDFARYVHSGLAVVPHANLVKNISYNEMAMQTRSGYGKRAKLEAYEINLPLVHPPFVVWDKESDKRYLKSFIKHTMISKLRYDFVNT